MSTDPRRQHCLEGLADRALVGIGTTEGSALMDLALQVQESDTNAFDRAAAAVALAGFGSRLRPMTADLAARVETQALEVLPTFVTGAPTEESESILKGNTVLIPAITPAQIAAAENVDKVETRSAYGPPLRSLVAIDAYAEQAPPTSYAPMPGPLHAAFVHGPRPMPHAPPMPMANVPEAPPVFAPPPPAPLRADSVTPRRGSSTGVAIAGWLVAVVLLVALGGALLLLRRSRAAPTVPVAAPSAPSAPVATPIASAPPPVVPAASAAPARTMADERQALLDEGVAKVDFARTKEAPVAAGGDVVWAQKEQRGFVKVHGLVRNDPRQVQYQLWITDKGREDRYPVEGGIFDVDAEGNALVAVTPRLTVKQPAAFAVTLERAGGVVVSKRDHLVLTARLP